MVETADDKTKVAFSSLLTHSMEQESNMFAINFLTQSCSTSFAWSSSLSTKNHVEWTSGSKLNEASRPNRFITHSCA